MADHRRAGDTTRTAMGNEGEDAKDLLRRFGPDDFRTLIMGETR